jgi:hypothetical protein
VAHNGCWSSFGLWFECTTQKLLSKHGQQSEKTNLLHDCNSTLRTHLISCRWDYTSWRALFQVKEGAIANALVFSRHQPCWNVSGNIHVATGVTHKADVGGKRAH